MVSFVTSSYANLLDGVLVFKSTGADGIGRRNTHAFLGGIGRTHQNSGNILFLNVSVTLGVEHVKRIVKIVFDGPSSH